MDSDDVINPKNAVREKLPNLTTAEFIQQVAEYSGYRYSEVDDIIRSALDLIKYNARHGTGVNFPGAFDIDVYLRKAFKWYDPRDKIVKQAQNCYIPVAVFNESLKRRMRYNGVSKIHGGKGVGTNPYFDNDQEHEESET